MAKITHKGSWIQIKSLNKKDKKNYLVSSDPYLAYAKLSSLFKNSIFELDNISIHPSAIISNNSSIGKNVSIGANVVIGPNCLIDDNVIIKSNCSLVQDVYIGTNSIVHNGTVLGSDGFGYAKNKEEYVKIEQLGKLIIGKNVEIGSNCTLDRGALGDTEIHDGVILDNQIQIAHNVILGKNSASFCKSKKLISLDSSSLFLKISLSERFILSFQYASKKKSIYLSNISLFVTNDPLIKFRELIGK